MKKTLRLVFFEAQLDVFAATDLRDVDVAVPLRHERGQRTDRRDHKWCRFSGLKKLLERVHAIRPQAPIAPDVDVESPCHLDVVDRALELFDHCTWDTQVLVLGVTIASLDRDRLDRELDALEGRALGGVEGRHRLVFDARAGAGVVAFWHRGSAVAAGVGHFNAKRAAPDGL